MRMVFPPVTGRLINDLATDMNAFVESIFSEDSCHAKAKYSPVMDIHESDDGYELCLDLPGVLAEDVHVDVEEDVVTIHGTRRAREEASEGGKRRIERTFGEFRRVVRLPKAVDRDGVTAHYEHGVLTVSLPIAAQAGSRRVLVTDAGSKPESADPTLKEK
ncbi:MAG: Hsp20/alpha crystallin family protein [Pirellulales bacterium]|nr:Hsp20/alpha crystallin family protein [Pirellulales bacterium]